MPPSRWLRPGLWPPAPLAPRQIPWPGVAGRHRAGQGKQTRSDLPPGWPPGQPDWSSAMQSPPGSARTRHQSPAARQRARESGWGIPSRASFGRPSRRWRRFVPRPRSFPPPGRARPFPSPGRWPDGSLHSWRWPAESCTARGWPTSGSHAPSLWRSARRSENRYASREPLRRPVPALHWRWPGRVLRGAGHRASLDRPATAAPRSTGREKAT